MGSEERPASDHVASDAVEAGVVEVSVAEDAVEAAVIEAVEALAAARFDATTGRAPDLDHVFDETVAVVFDVLVALHADYRGVDGVGDDCAEKPRAVADIDDATLERVVDSLTRPELAGEPRAIDYAALDVRHLGRLYERLLDYELRIESSEAQVADEPSVSLVVATDDRKARGAYYTPETVVDYVVERTLGPLVEDVRDEVGDLDDPADAREFTRRLLDLTVVDPAMGCGSFLVGVVDLLAAELRDAWDETNASPSEPNAPPTDSDGEATETTATRSEATTASRSETAVAIRHDLKWARRRVVEHCIYGVDNDPLAVDVARATLRLHAESDIASLDRHLAVGDSLIGCDGHDLATLADEAIDLHDDRDRRRLRRLADARISALVAEANDGDVTGRDSETYVHWPLTFPSVFDVDVRDDSDVNADDDVGVDTEGGFDAVVGNPPWVATAGRGTISASLDSSFRSYLEAAFETATDQFDLYVAFCERMLALAPGGRVGVVVPDAILTRESNELVRRHLLSRTSLDYVVGLGAVFDGVGSGVAVLVAGGSNEDVRCADVSGDLDALRSLDADADANETSYTRISQSVFAAQDAARFRIRLDEATRSIVDIVDDHPPLKRVVSVSRGEELGKRAAVLDQRGQHADPSDTVHDRRPVAPGVAIRRYGVDADELRSISEDRVVKAATNYRSPKLVFRQTSDTPVGTYDDQSLVTLKSVYNLRPRSSVSDHDAVLKHVLGVLDSRLFAFYHYVTHAAYRSVFPQLNQSTLAAFPAGHADPDSELVAAVDERLRLETERQGVEPDLLATLGDYEDGRRLDALPWVRLAPGASDSVLGETAAMRRKLRIGSAAVEVDDNVSTVFVTARFKPDAVDSQSDETTRTDETDRWGYVETDLIPALTFDASNDRQRALVRAFVPAVVERAGGFAGFRANATQTNSPLDRLGALTLPDLSTAADELDAHRRQVARATTLDERIETVERVIDDRVYELYGLSDDEIAVVERQFDGQ